MLDLIIDSDLLFDNHGKVICKKASQKLTAILRMADIMSKENFESQFSCCLLIWMICIRILTNLINRIHEREFYIMTEYLVFKCP